MSDITLQILEGLERGQVYENLATPVTIGREEDNSIQLNDERVSRFHSKIQEDNGRFILTDLDSTNGTRVNGHPIQMRVLQLGDQVSIGRCLLLFGSKEQIKNRIAELSHLEESTDSSRESSLSPSGLLDSHTSASKDKNIRPSELFPQGPPPPPPDLRPFQCAEISDFMSYTHEQIRYVLQTSYEDASSDPEEPPTMNVNWLAWQHLTQLEMDLAIYLRKLAEPENS